MNDFITLARVVKTQGRIGEVGAEVHSDVPGRFVEGMRLFALAPDGSRRELKVEDLWPHRGLLIFKFAGIDSISEAEAILKCELQVPAQERAALEPGWTYISDLAGCAVFDGERAIGKVEDVEFGAGEAPLLVVRGEAKEPYEIPYAEEYLERVDLVAKEIRMKLPDGLLEINAPVTHEEKRKNVGS